MAKRKFVDKLPPRKDGKPRTKRQKQTLVNNRNFMARQYYAKRDEHMAERKRLRRDNREAVNLIATLRTQLNQVSHELVELRRAKK